MISSLLHLCNYLLSEKRFLLLINYMSKPAAMVSMCPEPTPWKSLPVLENTWKMKERVKYPGIIVETLFLLSLLLSSLWIKTYSVEQGYSVGPVPLSWNTHQHIFIADLSHLQCLLGDFDLPPHLSHFVCLSLVMRTVLELNASDAGYVKWRKEAPVTMQTMLNWMEQYKLKHKGKMCKWIE